MRHERTPSTVGWRVLPQPRWLEGAASSTTGIGRTKGRGAGRSGTLLLFSCRYGVTCLRLCRSADLKPGDLKPRLDPVPRKQRRKSLTPTLSP